MQTAESPVAPERQAETTLWSGNPSHLDYLGTYIFGVLFFWLVIPAILVLRAFIATKRTRYEVTTERIRICTGLLTKRVEELELYRVKDTSLQQTLNERLRGLGTIIVTSTDASSPIVHLRAIPNAGDLREKLRHEVERMRRAKGVREWQ